MHKLKYEKRIGSSGIDKDIECDGIMSSLLEDRDHTQHMVSLI
jgi:hypothetical protein